MALAIKRSVIGEHDLMDFRSASRDLKYIHCKLKIDYNMYGYIVERHMSGNLKLVWTGLEPSAVSVLTGQTLEVKPQPHCPVELSYSLAFYKPGVDVLIEAWGSSPTW
jgi:hypothetical protein